MTQFFGIARLTALEASRQPIFLLLTTVALLFIALLPVLITHVITDSARMVRDSALALQLVSGLILVCYAATSTITRELRKGTLASILSKPVNRVLFFLAKFAGVAWIMAVFSLTTTLATLLSVRTAAIPFYFDWWGSGPLVAGIAIAYIGAALHNYFTRMPFVSRTYALVTIAVIMAFGVSCLVSEENTPGSFGAALAWNILPAGLLICLAVVLLGAWAVSLATRFDLISTFSICLGILLLGLMSDYLFGRKADDHWLFAFLHDVTPNWQHFWAADALHLGRIPWSYTLSVAAYAGLYAAVVLSGGLLAFSRMEVK